MNMLVPGRVADRAGGAPRAEPGEAAAPAPALAPARAWELNRGAPAGGPRAGAVGLRGLRGQRYVLPRRRRARRGAGAGQHTKMVKTCHYP